MPKKERASFFGKIMGGSVTDDDYQRPQVSQAPMQQQQPMEAEELAPEADEDEDQETVTIEEEVTEVQPAQAPARQATPAAAAPVTSNGEEWMSDFEGQLNIDMYQTKDNVIIKSTIAGVKPEDIDITVANDMVTIKGARRKEENIAQDDYFYQECYWGNFSRSVIIPVDIDSEQIEADLKDGILTVIIPKAAKAKTKKVRVKGL
jgi:HSP20 family protein